MLRNSTIRNLGLILLLAALLIGVIHLFMLRFQAGDVYPAYSSLRSDPLGTRAFYESLAKLKNIAPQRNYKRLQSIKVDNDAAVFYLGAQIPSKDSFSQETSELLDQMTQAGGRLVISYFPVNKIVEKDSCSEYRTGSPDKSNIQAKSTCPEQDQLGPQDAETIPAPGADQPTEASPKKEKVAGKNESISIKQHWGIGFAYNEKLVLGGKDKKLPVIEARSLGGDLPATISWHTTLYFELYDTVWQTLYAVDDRPVIIARPMGQGTIVLCADSFFFSNEALRSERHPGLLIWLLGGKKNIIFDETHFGIRRVPGVAGLLRHYRFHWFFGALALVALLFVWKNAVYFVPPRKIDLNHDLGVVSEKDNSRGLIALLRRNIGRREIIAVCGQEWQKTFKADKRLPARTLDQIKDLLQAETRSAKNKSDPVTVYRNISRLLKRRGLKI